MKDYYKILDLAPNASEEQIRKAYRHQALRYHPDRNSGDPAAGERFREIAEAYGVLADPVKRRQYDQLRATAGSGPHRPAGGFGYSQEDILRDLFRDARFNHVFRDLFGEFERAGFRFDQRFFDQAFFGGRRGVFGGVFFWAPFGGTIRKQVRPPGAQPQNQPSAKALPWLDSLKKLGTKAIRYLRGEPHALPGPAPENLDMVFDLNVSSATSREGGWVQIAVPRGRERETLKVRIPSNVRSGTRLRLKGKGLRRDAVAGDLYLTIRLS